MNIYDESRIKKKDFENGTCFGVHKNLIAIGFSNGLSPPPPPPPYLLFYAQDKKKFMITHKTL